MADATPRLSPPDAAPESMAEQGRVVAASLGGLGMQFVLVAVALGLLTTGNLNGLGLIPFTLAGLLPWAAAVVAAILRKARATEAYELEAARRGGEAARTIFESEIDARPAGRRLERFLKLGLPIIGGIVGIFLLYNGLTILRTVLVLRQRPFTAPDLLAGVTGAAAFFGFVAGFYLLGLGGSLKRPVLRGAAVYLLGTVILFALVAAAAAIEAAVGIRVVSIVVYYALPIITLIVGVEILLNLVLELYRPAATGETVDSARPAFNPRVVEFAVSPGGVVRQLNEAFRYQFGFEVTQSWFVGVLRKSAALLLLVGALILVLLSTLVVVRPHQRGLVTTFGRLDNASLEPGLHVKWPWPISRARLVETGRIRTLVVGTETDLVNHSSYLWSNQHTQNNGLLIVSGTGQTGEAAGPAIGLAAADLLVQWRVDENQVHDFVAGYAEPTRRLQTLADQALAREIARYDIDSAIGSRRTDVAAAVETRLRSAVDGDRLGIDIVSVGLKSVRPPVEAAEAFNASVAAEQDSVRLVKEGEAQRDGLLAQVAGSTERALELSSRIRALERAVVAEDADAADLSRTEAEITTDLLAGGGSASENLLQARAVRWQSENSARSRTARARALVEPFAKAADVFRKRLYLEAIRGSLADRAKDIYLTPSPVQMEFEGESGLGIRGAGGLRMPEGEQ